MALGISPQYSFFQSPEGDLFVKSQSQGGKPSTRIKRLDSSSPETLSKIANGTAKLIKLDSSPECVPVEVKELKKVIKHLLSKPENKDIVKNTLSKLSSSNDISSLLNGAHVLSEDWKGHIDEIKSLSGREKIEKALNLQESLHQGITNLTKNEMGEEAKPLEAYAKKVQHLLNKELKDIDIDDSEDARDFLNLAREVQGLAQQMEQTNQKIPAWLAEVRTRLVKPTKIAIKELGQSTTVPKGAAQKGEALRVATEEMISHLKASKELISAGVSNQDVYLGETAVFKRTQGARPAEEEALADGIGQIFDPDLYVPQLVVKSLNPEKLGIALLTPEQEKQAIPMEALDQPDQKDHFKALQASLKSPEGATLLQPSAKKMYDQDIKALNGYRNGIANAEIFRTLEYKDSMGNEITFDEWATINPSKLQDPVKREAFRATRMQKPTLGRLYPDFVSGRPATEAKHLQELFERGANQRWEIQLPSTQKWVAVASYTEVILAFATGIQVRAQGTDALSSEQKTDLTSLSTPGIIKYQPASLDWVTESQIGAQTTAKVKIKNMLTLKKIDKNGLTAEFLAKVTSPAEQAKAVRALYVQPVDLHYGNIGLSPLLTPEHAADYEDAKFSYGQRKQVPLSQIMLDYIAGDVDGVTSVECIKTDNTKTTVPIKLHPGLLDTLDSDWGFKFFDTDLNMSESNVLLQHGPNAVAPVRYILTADAFAFKPLSPQVVKELAQDANKIEEAMRYLKNDYHPLLLRMTPDEKEEFRELLDDELSAYSLGADLVKDLNNLNSLRTKFAINLAEDPSDEIWQKLDLTLNTYVVPEGKKTTLAQLAEKQHVNADELMQLNPSLTSMNDPLEAGTRLELPLHYIPSDSTSTMTQIAQLKNVPLKALLEENQIPLSFADQPLIQGQEVKIPSLQSDALKEKRKEIAVQLFPKATIAQQNAFKERLENQAKYFRSAAGLEKIDIYDQPMDESIDLILEKVRDPSIPLSRAERHSHEQYLQWVKTVPNPAEKTGRASDFQKSFLEKIRPSLANIIKVHYPITAELFELLAVTKQPMLLPDWSSPVETLVQRARSMGINSSNSPAFAAIVNELNNLP